MKSACMITAAVSFKASMKPKRFFFLALFLLIAFPPFRFFSALLAVSSQYHGDFCFVKRFLKKYFFLRQFMRTPFLLYKVVEESINLILYFFIYTSAIQRNKHIKKAHACHAQSAPLVRLSKERKTCKVLPGGWGYSGAEEARRFWL